MASRATRTPRQARSHSHVQRILDATADLAVDVGVAGLTMAAVGAAAGSAPGSLYQFFPSREALIDALAEREAAIVEACVEAALAGWRAEGEATPASLAGALLPPLLAVYRARPAWGELLHALANRGAPGSMEQALDARIEAMLADALLRLDPQSEPDRRLLAAAILLDLGHAGLLLASRSGRDAVLDEVRRALTAYLTAWLSPSGRRSA
jgi:AcrR family transcriptional regulator